MANGDEMNDSEKVIWRLTEETRNGKLEWKYYHGSYFTTFKRLDVEFEKRSNLGKKDLEEFTFELQVNGLDCNCVTSQMFYKLDDAIQAQVQEQQDKIRIEKRKQIHKAFGL